MGGWGVKGFLNNVKNFSFSKASLLGSSVLEHSIVMPDINNEALSSGEPKPIPGKW